jgi:hypothetical protein
LPLWLIFSLTPLGPMSIGIDLNSFERRKIEAPPPATSPIRPAPPDLENEKEFAEKASAARPSRRCAAPPWLLGELSFWPVYASQRECAAPEHSDLSLSLPPSLAPSLSPPLSLSPLPITTPVARLGIDPNLSAWASGLHPVSVSRSLESASLRGEICQDRMSAEARKGKSNRRKRGAAQLQEPLSMGRTSGCRRLSLSTSSKRGVRLASAVSRTPRMPADAPVCASSVSPFVVFQKPLMNLLPLNYWEMVC